MTESRAAVYEMRAQRSSTGSHGYIDALVPGLVAIEMKSAGKDLDAAEQQALDYLDSLSDAEMPRYVLTSDFKRFRLVDLQESAQGSFEFGLDELPVEVERLAFLAGYGLRQFGSKEQEAASIKAAQLMAGIWEQLEGSGFTDHEASVFMVRTLFALYADDSAVWERDLFLEFIETRTSEDGSDLGAQLSVLFQAMARPTNARMSHLDELVQRFPYVNGDIYQEVLGIPAFNKSMRDTLLTCCAFNWSDISPAIFGSLFQAVKDSKARRGLGEYYTTETNILKLIRPMFLDQLRERFDEGFHDPAKLRALRRDMGKMRFLDPAAGCGNFLLVSYREMRRLELDILLRLQDLGARGPFDRIRQRRADVLQAVLFATTWKMLPPEVRSTWQGDVTIDATHIPVYGKKGPFGRRKGHLTWSPEVCAGWYHKEKDRRDKAFHEGIGRNSTDYVWAYDLHLAVTCGPGVNELFPEMILGAVYDTPGKEPGLNAAVLVQGIHDQGLPSGLTVTDRGYSQIPAERFHNQIASVGRTVVMSYKRQDLGRQDEYGGMLQVDGAWFAPCLPQRLESASLDHEDGDIDDATYQARLTERRDFKMRYQGDTKNGEGERWRCPAQGDGATRACPKYQPHRLAGKKYLPIVETPPAEPTEVCRNRSSTTKPKSRGLRHSQVLEYGSPEWKKAYTDGRNQIEAKNRLIKNEVDEAMASRDQRRFRGLGNHTLFTALRLVATNIRAVIHFLSRSEADQQAPASVKAKTDLIWDCDDGEAADAAPEASPHRIAGRQPSPEKSRKRHRQAA